MSDIPKRLRENPNYIHWLVMGEAADRIEELEKALDAADAYKPVCIALQEELAAANAELLSIAINDLPEKDRENDQLQARVAVLESVLSEIKEVWAGSDGLIPETCPEGYLQRLLKQCYQLAANALAKGESHE